MGFRVCAYLIFWILQDLRGVVLLVLALLVLSMCRYGSEGFGKYFG